MTGGTIYGKNTAGLANTAVSGAAVYKEEGSTSTVDTTDDTVIQ
jgi:hypothetical protein